MASRIHRARFGRGISAAALAATLVISAPAMAQINSTLRGRVTGAQAGATVTATDVNTGQRIRDRKSVV